MPDQTYTIVRFHKEKEREVIKEEVTLEEAQEHCQDPSTSGEDWFDGFYED